MAPGTRFPVGLRDGFFRLQRGFGPLVVAALLISGCGSADTETATVDDDPIGALHLIPKPRTISGDRRVPPGHVNAALVSYAELNESGERAELTSTVSLGSSSLWIGGPDTPRVVEDVVREVAALVPGPYFHMGGDEAFASTQPDYAAFLRVTQDIVESHAKTMVGWEEISGSGLEAPLWTETVVEAAEVDLMMFPRLLGYAEIGWSHRDGRDWEEYSARLAQHGARLDARGMAFYRSPLIDWPP